MPFDDIDEQEPFPRIARPANSPLPPVSLRGLGAIPLPGVPENKPAAAATPSPAITAPKPPTLLGQRRMADERELTRLNDTGSGVAQVAKAHPVAGGVLRGLNTLGGIVAPRMMQQIPGTEEHHQQLVGREQGNIKTDIAEQGTEAATAKAQAEAEAEPAKADEAKARAEALRNPPEKLGVTPEEKAMHDLMTGGPNGTAKINPQTGKPYTYIEAFTALKQAAQDVKPDPAVKDKEQDITDILAANNWPNDPKHREMARTKIAQRAPAIKLDMDTASARGSNAALANVPPHLIAPATAAAEKAAADYAQSDMVSQNIAAIMAAARSGNVVAYQLLPQEGALQVTTTQGVHRINMAEIQNYGGGSAWDRMQGAIGKQVSGKSIPPKVLDAMADLQDVYRKGAAIKYRNTIKAVNHNYGANFQPLDFNEQGAGEGGHVIEIKGRQYRYKGTGDTADMKNYEEVQKK